MGIKKKQCHICYLSSHDPNRKDPETLAILTKKFFDGCYPYKGEDYPVWDTDDVKLEELIDATTYRAYAAYLKHLKAKVAKYEQAGRRLVTPPPLEHSPRQVQDLDFR